MEQDNYKPGNNVGLLLKRKGASAAGFWRQVFTRPAYAIVVVSNLAIFFIPGLDLKTQATTFLYIYLIQSLLIGLVHVVKLNTYRFAPALRPQDWKNPHLISIFFIVHFGFFHFVYTFFIPAKNVDWDVVLYGTTINLAVLIINTIRHFSTENSGRYSAADFMFLPYVRIIPIHIAIIVGGFFSAIAGSFAPVMVALGIIKTALEMFLEYLQSLGISFQELKNTNEET
jgi:hypothetical protein